MAASTAVSAFGTFLIWNYHKILELTNISGPSQSMDTIDVTSHDSDDSYREFIAGMRSGGDVSIEGNLITTDSNGQIAFHTDMQAGTKRNCFIVLPMAVGASMSFSALGKGFDMSFPFEDKASVSGTLQIAGKPTLLTTQSTGMSGLTGIEQTETAALSISPAIAVGTYAYTCSVNTASTWVKLTPVAASHTIYVQGTAVATGEQSGEITLGAAGTTTDILIVAYESSKSPRLYTLTVTRPAA
jgi:predicted secreted protein